MLDEYINDQKYNLKMLNWKVFENCSYKKRKNWQEQNGRFPFFSLKNGRFPFPLTPSETLFASESYSPFKNKLKKTYFSAL